jgi:hypothetical protein
VVACGGGLRRPTACVAVVAVGASGGGRSAHPAVCVAAVAGSGAPGACMAVAMWWRWRRRSGRGGPPLTAGGPVLCGGPVRGWARVVFFAFLTLFKSLCRELYMPFGTNVLRGFVGALGTELFAGRMVPSALCREHPLGRACAERKPSCAESMLVVTYTPLSSCRPRLDRRRPLFHG